MWIQISAKEAANILVAGGKVDEGFYRWAGGMKLVHPNYWRKARNRKALARRMAHTQADGWWVYRKG